MGRFCFWALASFCLVRKVLWLCRQGDLELVSQLHDGCRLAVSDLRRKKRDSKQVVSRLTGILTVLRRETWSVGMLSCEVVDPLDATIAVWLTWNLCGLNFACPIGISGVM
jgi:hypothetical protein